MRFPFSSEAWEVSLSTLYKIAAKTTTFERWAKRALKSGSKSLEQSERSFPLYTPLTGAIKIALGPFYSTFNKDRGFWSLVDITRTRFIKKEDTTSLLFKSIVILNNLVWWWQNGNILQQRWKLYVPHLMMLSLSASQRGLTNGCGHLSIYCIQQSIWKITMTYVYSYNFFKWHIVSRFTVGRGVASVQG